MTNLTKESVGSGRFIVRKTDNRILEAHLGTCVGVALCDRDAGVGGIHHILLPEPPSSRTPWDAETYASTGMPLFIQALIDEGASHDSLEATIAGGALVGPVSMSDLHLDIGGRTAEVVTGVLKSEGIPIIRSETGGFFTCSLRLDLSTFECSISLIGNGGNSIRKPKKKLTMEEIDPLIYRVRPIPQIALKVMRLVNSPNYRIKDIASEIRKDQVLSAKLLNLCNSVSASPSRRIDSIDHALVMLGERWILQMVVSASVEMFFQHSERGYSLCKGGLYHHAMGTALAAEKLAELTGKVSPDVAYTAGLLHDIGKVALDQYVSELHPFFYRRVYSDELSLVEVEREALGVTHPMIGERLAELWDLPGNLKDAIGYHHEPEKASVDLELSHLIYLANLLMSRFQVGSQMERNEPDRLHSSAETLDLDLSLFPEIVDSIPWKTFQDIFVV